VVPSRRKFVSPAFTGAIADGSSGLLRGLAWSAATLAAGALMAVLQKALTPR
jgi:hypothetical protein